MTFNCSLDGFPDKRLHICFLEKGIVNYEKAMPFEHQLFSVLVVHLEMPVLLALYQELCSFSRQDAGVVWDHE